MKRNLRAQARPIAGNAYNPATCEPLEPRVLMSGACPASTGAAASAVIAAPGDLTFGENSPNGNKTLKITSADGIRATFKLLGAGTGTLSAGDGASSYGITFTGTDKDSVASIKVKGKGELEEIFLNGVTVNGSLKSFTARNVNLDGNFTVTGTLSNLLVDDMNEVSNDQSTIDIQGQGAAGETVSMKFDALFEATITSAIPIASFTADEWADRDFGGVPDSLTAVAVTKMNIRGDPSDQEDGDMGADVTVTDPASVLASFRVKGAMGGSALRSAGDITKVTVGRMADSTVFAGVADDAASDALPTLAQIGGKSIGSITIKGKGAAAASPGFSNSNVAASNIGKIRLKSVNGPNSGDTFGFAAQTVGDYRGSVHLTAADLGTPGDFDVTDDYVLRILGNA